VKIKFNRLLSPSYYTQDKFGKVCTLPPVTGICRTPSCHARVLKGPHLPPIHIMTLAQGGSFTRSDRTLVCSNFIRRYFLLVIYSQSFSVKLLWGSFSLDLIKFGLGILVIGENESNYIALYETFMWVVGLVNKTLEITYYT